MKKVILFVVLLSVVFAGCFNNKDGAESKVTVKNDGKEVTVYSKNDFGASEFIVNAVLEEKDINADGKLLIVKNRGNETMVAVATAAGVKSGDKIFSISRQIPNITIIQTGSYADLQESKRVTETLVGDFNKDGVVGITDFIEFAQSYGAINDPIHDIYPPPSGDGKVNLYDFLEFAKNYGKTAPVTPTPTGIEVLATNNLVSIGSTLAFEATVVYSDGSRKKEKVNWSINNTTVATLTVPVDAPWAAQLKFLAAGTVTITVEAYGFTKTFSYTLAPQPTGIIVHVKGYTTVWAWDIVTATKNYTGGVWPGQPLADDPVNAGWKLWTLDGVDEVNVIFSNAGSGKTLDLKVKRGEWWYYNSQWYQSNPEDNVKPTISIMSPAPLATVTGTVDIKCAAQDNTKVTKVEYYFGTKLIGTVEADPFTLTWNSANVPSGTDKLSAKAYDAAGNIGVSAEVTITTKNSNVPPVAEAGSDITVLAGGTANFDGSKSYDPNGSIVSYTWDNGLTGVSASKVYPTIGEYIVKLTVTDNDGATSTDTVKVSVVAEIANRDFREETVYFMLTDRFADGNKTNNNIWGDEYLPNGEAQMYDYSEDKSGILSYYHGGDFDGVIQNLDYIKEMGFTAIWITPVVKQPEGRYFYSGTGNAYQASAFHGYWGYDFDKIDPHLHSSGKTSDGWSDFDKFVKAVHAKGMKVMLDIVANHGHSGAATAPTKWLDQGTTILMDNKTFSLTNDPYKDPLDKTKGFFNYIGGYQMDGTGLLDFNERGPNGYDARPHLINVYKKFIDYGVDSFRIDTLAYMTNEFWGEFADAMYNHAKSKGNNYFYMVGEPWCGRSDGIARVSKDTTNSLHMIDMQASCLDYPGQMSNVFKSGGDYANFLNVIREDETKFGYSAEEASWSAMFVDNHDCFRANGIFTMEQYMNALNYIYLFRGVPVVYYGTEATYLWDGAKSSTNKDDVVARWMLGQKGIDFVKANKPPMYKHIKTLNATRKVSAALQKGKQENIVLSGDKAVLKRTYNNNVAYVAISKGAAYSQSFTGVENGTYKRLIPDSANGTIKEETVTVSDGTLTAAVGANSYVVIYK